jgi:uncharacterized membrane protein YphA (DoxX/SURF4 family)
MSRYLPTLLLFFRLAVGGLFLYAGISKGLDPRAFAGEVAAYRLLPYSLNLLVAVTLPGVEIVCGGLLLWGCKVQPAALVLFGLEVLFAVVLASAIFRGLTISCGCFGAGTATSLPWALLRDLLLLALTLPLCFRRHVRAERDD